MKFYAKWSVTGIPSGDLEASKTYDLKAEDVKALVSVANGGDVPKESNAVLIPLDAWTKLQALGNALCRNCKALLDAGNVEAYTERTAA